MLGPLCSSFICITVGCLVMVSYVTGMHSLSSSCLLEKVKNCASFIYGLQWVKQKMKITVAVHCFTMMSYVQLATFSLLSYCKRLQASENLRTYFILE